jgi:hypothetical protein
VHDDVRGVTDQHCNRLCDRAHSRKSKEIDMKYVLAPLLSLMFASTAFADSSIMHWSSIVGVITSPGVDNAVADIHAGATPWTVTRGEATVNLRSGGTAFFVQGLVINGGKSTGTRGPISSVVGTLVCNAGDAGEQIIDTAPVPLSDLGNAGFSGKIGPINSPCNNPLFLVRIAQPAGAAGRWIATGAVRSTGDRSLFYDN